MGRIVAIASGDLLSTRPLNKYAVKLAKKQNPKCTVYRNGKSGRTRISGYIYQRI